MIAPNTLLQNRYLIKRRLAQGGMGAVYIAEAVHLDNLTVAVKETFFTDDHLRQQFKREAALLARLRHPALPTVHDHFSENDGQFLVMEYIPGDDFAALLEKHLDETGEPFDWRQVMTWADRLLDALDYLHTNEPPIIHRDIKPHNLKLTPRGKLFLIDFGLSKIAASASRSGGSVHGYTMAYAPPEQMDGSGTDERSDIYSLGATLYHLLTGKPPIDAKVREEISKHLMPDPLQPVHQVNQKAPFAVASMVAQAMAIKREERYQSAAAMHQYLKRFLTVTVVDAQAQEEKRLQQEAETKRKEEEQRQRLREEQRQREEEARRQAEIERLEAEELQRLDRIHQRQLAEQRQAEAQRQREAEEKRQRELEEQRQRELAEQQRRAAEEKQQRQADARRQQEALQRQRELAAPQQREESQKREPEKPQRQAEAQRQQEERQRLQTQPTVSTVARKQTAVESRNFKFIIAAAVIPIALLAIYLLFFNNRQETTNSNANTNPLSANRNANRGQPAATDGIEVLRYAIEIENVAGRTATVDLAPGKRFKLHFTPPANGYLYLLAPIEKGKLQTYLTAQAVQANSDFAFPAGEIWIDPPPEMKELKIIAVFAAQPITRLSFLAQDPGRKLTKDQQEAFDLLRGVSGATKIVSSAADNKVTVSELKSEQPIIFDVSFRR